MKKVVRRFVAISVLFASSSALPCSVFFVNGSADAVVAKNLDWFAGSGQIFINKRNIKKQAVLIDTQNPLVWTSKYMSLTLTGNGREFPWEGFNEKGLSVNVLQLLSSQTSPATTELPSVGSIQWVQYILDSSANLTEAIGYAKSVRVSNGTKLHYFVCDVTAACASFEYINGALVIHAGSDLPFKALTNSSYADSVNYYTPLQSQPQQTLLYQDWSVGSLHRFSRAAVWSQNYKPGQEDAVDHAFTGLFNLAQNVPATPTQAGWRTFWSMAFVLKSGRIYWRTVASPEIKSVDLSAFNPSCASGTSMLDLNTPGAGPMNDKFVAYTDAANRAAVQAWGVLPEVHTAAPILQIIENVPAHTQCLE